MPNLLHVSLTRLQIPVKYRPTMAMSNSIDDLPKHMSNPPIVSRIHVCLEHTLEHISALGVLEDEE